MTEVAARPQRHAGVSGLVRGIRPSPFIWDLLTTTITSAVSTAAALVLVRVLAEGLGPTEFGAYSLARRLLATVTAIVGLGMNVAIPRYIAVAASDRDRDAYFLAGLGLAILPSLLLLVAGAALGGVVSPLVFHTGGYALLWVATLVVTAANSVYGALYAFYRGAGRMGKANVWQTVTQCLVLVVCALVVRRGRADVVMMWSSLPCFCAVAPLTYLALRSARLPTLHLKAAVRELARYGLPRVPAGFALAALFAVGPLLAPYFASLREAGFLATGQYVLVTVESALVAFGVVALPKFARLVGLGQREAVAEGVTSALALVIHVGVFLEVQALLWSDQIVATLLGPRYEDAIPLMRIVLIAMVPYLGYVMLRSIVDAVEERAINTRNLLASLVLAAVVSPVAAGTGLGAIGLAAGMSLSLCWLGASTGRYLMKSFGIGWERFDLAAIVAINIVLAAIALIVKIQLSGPLAGVWLLTAGVGVALVLFAAYAAVLWKLRACWLIHLTDRIWATS